MENTTKPNGAAVKSAPGALKKTAAEAAEKTTGAAAETSRPAPVLTPLTINGRRVFVLRRGQPQALQREESQQKGQWSLCNLSKGEVWLLASSKPCFGRRRRPYFGDNFGGGHASAGFSEMNGRAESARVMEEEVTVGSSVLTVESHASADMLLLWQALVKARVLLGVLSFARSVKARFRKKQQSMRLGMLRKECKKSLRNEISVAICPRKCSRSSIFGRFKCFKRARGKLAQNRSKSERKPFVFLVANTGMKP
ncbi:hypothetical protein L596_002236 [Steinernema carpocapsae]|uniref:Uncharacterized protein n=1 Tax=Steinernema carpocapsae TaxID=34508 RepID=A0A4U8UPN8_STECR|nr:hypothetical protein L596_002236 [Steinernema carpocapsae]